MPMMLLGSDDSDEESSEEEPAITIWNELSIIERVGLNSADMSEKDLETAFSQIAMAFSCDHKILQRLELSLDILGGTVERISNTAEVLGAVHQNSVGAGGDQELRPAADPCRNLNDPRASPDLEESDGIGKISQPSGCPPIPSGDAYSVDDRPLDPDETASEAPAAELPPPPNPSPEPLPSKQLAPRKTNNKNSPLDTLRQRHKGKAALSKKKGDKDKKKTNVCRQLSIS
ncbi:hypothetical protein F7725_000631, partial [Dissostichus mawsoni]